MDNKEAYHDFIKLVNVFMEGRIGSERLVKESMRYLGNGELSMQFMNIIGWDEKTQFGLESSGLDTTENAVSGHGGFRWISSICFCW